MYAAAVDFDVTLLGLLIECGSEPRRGNRRLARTGKQFLALPIRNTGQLRRRPTLTAAERFRKDAGIAATSKPCSAGTSIGWPSEPGAPE